MAGKLKVKKNMTKLLGILNSHTQTRIVPSYFQSPFSLLFLEAIFVVTHTHRYNLVALDPLLEYIFWLLQIVTSFSHCLALYFHLLLLSMYTHHEMSKLPRRYLWGGLSSSLCMLMCGKFHHEIDVNFLNWVLSSLWPSDNHHYHAQDIWYHFLNLHVSFR